MQPIDQELLNSFEGNEGGRKEKKEEYVRLSCPATIKVFHWMCGQEREREVRREFGVRRNWANC